MAIHDSIFMMDPGNPDSWDTRMFAIEYRPGAKYTRMNRVITGAGVLKMNKEAQLRAVIRVPFF